MKNIAIGVDVGGNHISCAACDLVEKKFLPYSFTENGVDNQGTEEQILSVWVKTRRRYSIIKSGMYNRNLCQAEYV